MESAGLVSSLCSILMSFHRSFVLFGILQFLYMHGFIELTPMSGLNFTGNKFNENNVDTFNSNTSTTVCLPVCFPLGSSVFCFYDTKHFFFFLLVKCSFFLSIPRHKHLPVT